MIGVLAAYIVTFFALHWSMLTDCLTITCEKVAGRSSTMLSICYMSLMKWSEAIAWIYWSFSLQSFCWCRICWLWDSLVNTETWIAQSENFELIHCKCHVQGLCNKLVSWKGSKSQQATNEIQHSVSWKWHDSQFSHCYTSHLQWKCDWQNSGLVILNKCWPSWRVSFLEFVGLHWHTLLTWPRNLVPRKHKTVMFS